MHKNKLIITLILLITMFININGVEAETVNINCYYTDSNANYSKSPADYVTMPVSIQIISNSENKENFELDVYVDNNKKNYTIKNATKEKKMLGITFKKYFNDDQTTCPKYLVYIHSIGAIYITSDKTTMDAFKEKIRDEKGIKTFINPISTDENGTSNSSTSNNKTTTSTTGSCSNPNFDGDFDFKKTDYKYICFYKNDSNNSLIGLYTGDSKNYLKDYSPPTSTILYGNRIAGNYYQIFSDIENKAELKEIKDGKEKNIEVSLSMNLSYGKCPGFIYRISQHEETDASIKETVVYQRSNTGSEENAEKYTRISKQDVTTCAEVESTSGEMSGSSEIGEEVEINSCDDLLDQDTRDAINKILKYVRIIVPILIIVLGMLDFGKAILSSKEEEMKKAQATFIKRLIIGVAIFLLPTIINLLLDLADQAWKNGLFSNSQCTSIR